MLSTVTAPPLQIQVVAPTTQVVEGSHVDAEVIATADRAITWQRCEVSLATKVTYLHREGNLYGGRFTAPARRTDVHATQVLPGPGILAAGERVTLPVSLAVPPLGPGTTACPLVQVAWAVRVVMHVEGGYPPVQVDAAFTVLSRASDRAAAAAGAAAVAVDHGRAVLDLVELSSRVIQPGDVLRGVLTIDALRPLDARAARVLLVLRQHVHHGEWLGTDAARNPANQEKELDTVVACSNVAGEMALDPAEPVRLPFTLAVPEPLPAPSLHTDNFTLTWLLRGVLDRPHRRDPHVEVELLGQTLRG